MNADSSASPRDLALWMLDRCPLEATPPDGERGAARLVVPPQLAAEFDGAEQIEWTWDDDAEGRWSAAPGGRLFCWLLQHFRRHPPNVAPLRNVGNVHPLTAALFDAFELEKGHLQLGGCRLEDRPLLRRTALDAKGEASHYYFDEQGRPLAAERARLLGLTDLDGPPCPLSQAPLDAAAVESWAGRCPVDRRVSLETVVWCKFATGELTAVGESNRLPLPFEGWAAEILAGRVRPPPYQAPETGDESYRLAALDDGTLTAANAVEQCEVTGERVLRSRLQTCAATGRRALRELLAKCPVTGELVLEEELRPCRQCCQLVSPDCRDEDQLCRACRQMKPMGPADPRLSRILGEHPGLSVWRRWRIAETRDVYVLGAGALLRQLLLVLDKRTLAARHLAVRSRFSQVWTTPSDLEQQELLRG